MLKLNVSQLNYEYDNKFKTKYTLYFLSFLSIGFLVTLAVWVALDNSDEYTMITKETEIDGRVSEVDREHGYLYFYINDTLKYRMRGSNMCNYEYTEECFIDFLTDSDWFEKKTGADTVVITRQMRGGNSKRFVFVVGKELNKR